MAQPAGFYVGVFASVVDVLGLLLTAWRIYFRLKIGRFWWEDAWAAILLATGLPWFIAYWICLLATGLTAVVASWINSIAFTCIVTLARMSVLFSIIRIIHGNPPLLKFTYACVAFFVACWATTMVEKVRQCALDTTWQQTSVAPFCQVEKYISILELTSDCVSTLILVVLPLRMLWRVKLPRRQKRMILSIFASSVVLAFGALFHTIGQMLDIYVVMVAGWHVETALSIIVCNLLVAVTYVCHSLNHDKGETTETTSDDDDFTTRQRPPAPMTTLILTTVDLEVPATGQHSSALIEEKSR